VVVAAEVVIAGAGPGAAWLPVVADDDVPAHPACVTVFLPSGGVSLSTQRRKRSKTASIAARSESRKSGLMALSKVGAPPLVSVTSLSCSGSIQWLTEELGLSAREGVAEQRDRLVSRSEEHTSELQSRENLVCRLLLEKK